MNCLVISLLLNTNGNNIGHKAWGWPAGCSCSGCGQLCHYFLLNFARIFLGLHQMWSWSEEIGDVSTTCFTQTRNRLIKKSTGIRDFCGVCFDNDELEQRISIILIFPSSKSFPSLVLCCCDWFKVNPRKWFYGRRMYAVRSRRLTARQV